MTIVLDTSGLLAAIDGYHAAAREVQEHARTGSILSPFVLAELNYMVSTQMGSGHELSLLGEVGRGAYRLEPFSTQDVSEATKLIRKHVDLDISLADASNVILANRHDTLDHPLWNSRGRPLRLLPLDA